jgi:hypothetical protein
MRQVVDYYRHLYFPVSIGTFPISISTFPIGKGKVRVHSMQFQVEKREYNGNCVNRNLIEKDSTIILCLCF